MWRSASVVRAKKCAKMVLNLHVLPEDAIIPSSPKTSLKKNEVRAMIKEVSIHIMLCTALKPPKYILSLYEESCVMHAPL